MNLKVCGGSGQIIFIHIQTVYLNRDKSIPTCTYICNSVHYTVRNKGDLDSFMKLRLRICSL